MSTPRYSVRDHHGDLADPTRRRRPLGRLVARRVSGIVALLLLVALTAIGIGFLGFVHTVPSEEAVLDGNADGIVVLTGGTSRIPDAMQLLAAGRGKRLLISGVNKSTTPREIARLVPQFQDLVDCCVDLDYSALNTVGNAAETRRWALERKFRSLIVVTSNYHMPRSMAELGHRLPDFRLIPFPVVTERLRTDTWWEDVTTTRLMLSEFLKYVVAQIRMRLETPAVSEQRPVAGPVTAGHPPPGPPTTRRNPAS